MVINRILHYTHSDYLYIRGKDNISVQILQQNMTKLPVIEYSYDKNSWAPVEIGVTAIPVASGDRVYFRGDNVSFSDPTNLSSFCYFKIAGGTANIGGNVMSLVDKYCKATSLKNRGACFHHLFYNCPIISAPRLPATTLDANCYYRMFEGCTALEEAPKLPAVNLANGCYKNMFYGCINLRKPPKLSATNLEFECYRGMFYNCHSLEEMPVLPATTLANNCYYTMFGECYNLKGVTELPATTLAQRCYTYMFQNCSSLTKAPEIKATSFVTESLNGMFAGCNNLNEISIWFASFSTNGTYLWVQNVASSGTFIAPNNIVVSYGPSAIPNGWAVHKREANL